MSALVPLKDMAELLPPKYYYRLGSSIMHVDLTVCVTCETVVGSVKDNPACPVCTLREEIERALDESEEGWDD